VALELIHNFSLVHDDIQDGDELRRGRPTVWKVFGTAQAINAGDGLLILGLRTALSGHRLDAKSSLSAQEALLSATFRLIEGQVQDLALEGRGDGGVAEYVDMAKRKTGALFGCALELGAIAMSPPDVREAHRALGEVLGIAFQIRDDVLGLWGDEEETGKPVGSDLLRHKRSFALASGCECDPGLRELLRREPVPVVEAMARLEKTGARAAAETEVVRLCQEAEELAQGLPWSPWAHGAFTELLLFLKERET
jgi:geranylgeranyl diphosphate synthase type I